MLGEWAGLRMSGSKCRGGLRQAAYDPAACHCVRQGPAYPEGNTTNDPISKQDGINHKGFTSQCKNRTILALKSIPLISSPTKSKLFGLEWRTSKFLTPLMDAL